MGVRPVCGPPGSCGACWAQRLLLGLGSLRGQLPKVCCRCWAPTPVGHVTLDTESLNPTNQPTALAHPRRPNSRAPVFFSHLAHQPSNSRSITAAGPPMLVRRWRAAAM